MVYKLGHHKYNYVYLVEHKVVHNFLLVLYICGSRIHFFPAGPSVSLGLPLSWLLPFCSVFHSNSLWCPGHCHLWSSSLQRICPLYDHLVLSYLFSILSLVVRSKRSLLVILLCEYYHSVKFSILAVRCILRIPPSFSVKMSYL